MGKVPLFLGMYGHKGSHAAVLEDRRTAGQTTRGRMAVGLGVRAGERSGEAASAARRRNDACNSPSTICAPPSEKQQLSCGDHSFSRTRMRKAANGARESKRKGRAGEHERA
jgi:hypothetical protein